ncbi:RmlC-like cupin domain-containing protein [Ochromonadaceae sp. CCMP2298]|nr:RmlC-like cupin domain-containing protein [Ochromonadaceae sp. CCMP2298]
MLNEPSSKKAKIEAAREPTKFEEDARIYEYTSAANPHMAPVPVAVLAADQHESGPTRIIPFDLSRQMHIEYPATSPNLLASFLRICENESLTTHTAATSQAFYVIRGEGSSVSELGLIEWSQGDLFVIPKCDKEVVHSATADTAIYWVNDNPLMQYLGVVPSTKKFEVTLFKKERLLAEVERIKHQPGAEHRNRMGILLGNKITEDTTKTLTHTLWSLLNVLPAGDAQRPHRHNSVALDLCVWAEEGNKVYTMMGPELDEAGWVKNPQKCLWKTGAVFSTPPGWWHSHHNETGKPAWVLPMQDAGLYTHQRTLDIQFST